MEKGFLDLPLVLWYPFLAFILLAIVILTMPKKKIKELFFESLAWGLLASFIFSVVIDKLHLLDHVYHGPFSLLGSPIWFNLAWSPAIMLYLYNKPPMRKTIQFWIYLLSFSLMGAMLDQAFHGLGLIKYYHWSPLVRFFVGVIWFYGAAVVNEKYMDRQKRTTD